MLTAEKTIQYTARELHSLFTLMRSRGGSFASALAEAWFHGDEENRSKIEETWPELVDKYYGLYGFCR